MNYLQWAAGLILTLAVLALAGKTGYLEGDDRDARWHDVITAWVIGFLVILSSNP